MNATSCMFIAVGVRCPRIDANTNIINRDADLSSCRYEDKISPCAGGGAKSDIFIVS